MVISGGRVKGINGFKPYMITEKGVVHGKRCILKPQIDKDGYEYVRLYDGRKYHTKRVSRLVAEAFIPRCSESLVVNHIDKDRRNNNVSNLEWVTQQKNVEHSIAKKHTLISPNGDVVDIFNLAKFCRENGLSQGAMNQLSLGNTAKNHGWRSIKKIVKSWKFISPDLDVHTTESLKDFCEKMNLNPCQMSLVYRGKKKSYKGWTSGVGI